jgi:hypothetical protein
VIPGTDCNYANDCNVGTQAEQLNAETTPYENIHSYDQGPSEEKDDMEAAAYEELRQSAFKALQCIEEDFAKLRERYSLSCVLTMITFVYKADHHSTYIT